MADGYPEEFQTRLVPEGAIKIPLPDIQQPNGYSCGAAALMAIASYYHRGPHDIQAFETLLGTTPEEGTDYRKIVACARQLDLQVEVQVGMSLGRLKSWLNRGVPVICSIQAYSPHVGSYSLNQNDSGHYVVGVGYDSDGYLYFMDPDSQSRVPELPNPAYAAIHQEDMLLRWHDNEGTVTHPDIVYRLGIAICPKDSPCLRVRIID